MPIRPKKEAMTGKPLDATLKSEGERESAISPIERFIVVLAACATAAELERLAVFFSEYTKPEYRRANADPS